MIIEKTADEIIIRLPAYVNTEGLQRLVDYLIYQEATSKSEAKQTDVNDLAREVKQGWWANNKDRLIR